MNIVYDLTHALFFVLFKFLFRYKVVGRENVPKEGPVILASNHASYLDPPFIGTGLWRRVNFVAKEELFNRPWKRFILTRWKAIPVRRERLDKGTLKAILDRLKAGEVVGLFPEGTRSPDGDLLPGKSGIGMIVAMAGAPVVPVYIRGSLRTLSKQEKRLKFVPITVTYGAPVEFAGLEGEAGHDRYRRIADDIMARIEGLRQVLPGKSL